MNDKIPHLVQYQGSKRLLANQILKYMPQKFDRLIEPFSGLASISIAASYQQRSNSFLLNDINEPLILMLQEAIESPNSLVSDYTSLWQEQFKYDDHCQHYYDIRSQFNNGHKSPANMLYLLARCVKGSVRYSKSGDFNQSVDKRRHGTNPLTLTDNIFKISALLKGKTQFMSTDYKNVLELSKPGDLVYLDPPYQGVSLSKNTRYYSGVSFIEFVNSLKLLESKGIDFIVSYDGMCGNKVYGQDLPNDLHCKKIILNAGVSTQATLLGKQSTTYESLYVSNSLIPHCSHIMQHSNIMEARI